MNRVCGANQHTRDGSPGVSVAVLLELIEQDNLGDPHPILAGGERYVSPRVADRARHEFDGQLAADGIDDSDRTDRVRTALAVAHRAHTEYYGWITDGDQTLAVLVAAIGRVTTVLTRTEDRVRIGRADHRRLPHTLVGHLPDSAPGGAESITLREADYTAATARTSRGVLRGTDAAAPEPVRRLNALLRAPRRGGARLYTAARNGAGTRTRSPEWITVLDLADGRWAVYRTPGGGERAITAVPGSTHLLTAKLAEFTHALN